MKLAPPRIHPSAVCDPGAEIGSGTTVWHFCHIMAGAKIGKNCSFGQNCFVAGTVIVADGVRVQNNVSLYDGVRLEKNVFCGPSCVFTNVRRPRAHLKANEYERTLVCEGVTIGANATIRCGVTLGAFCLVGAGTVVTEDVPPHALVCGVPARRRGWVSRNGEPLSFDAQGLACCSADGSRYRISEGTVLLVCS